MIKSAQEIYRDNLSKLNRHLIAWPIPGEIEIEEDQTEPKPVISKPTGKEPTKPAIKKEPETKKKKAETSSTPKPTQRIDGNDKLKNVPKKRIFKEHCSSLKKSLVEWEVKENKEFDDKINIIKSKIRPTVIDAFDGPKIKIGLLCSNEHYGESETSDAPLYNFEKTSKKYCYVHSRLKYNDRADVHTEYLYDIPNPDPPLNI